MKQVAVFNDLSGFGNCSLAASLPVLSILGIQCNPIPTMSLTGQGGYEVAYRKDLTEMLPHYTEAWSANKAEFTGIYSGYLTGPQQVAHVIEFLSAFRKEDTFLLVDPVMGDNGHTYQVFSQDLLEGMKRLTRQADLITPNLTEACLLADLARRIRSTCSLCQRLYLFRSKAILRNHGNVSKVLGGHRPPPGKSL